MHKSERTNNSSSALILTWEVFFFILMFVAFWGHYNTVQPHNVIQFPKMGRFDWISHSRCHSHNGKCRSEKGQAWSTLTKKSTRRVKCLPARFFRALQTAWCHTWLLPWVLSTTFRWNWIGFKLWWAAWCCCHIFSCLFVPAQIFLYRRWVRSQMERVAF